MTAHWNLIVTVLCVLLAAGLVIKEYRRTAKQWLAARIATTLLAVAALLWLTIPVTLSGSNTKSTEAILLTESYQKDSISAIEQKAGHPLPAYTVQQYAALPSTTHLQLHVTGKGLSAESWLALPQPASLIPHLSPAAGITAIHWQQQLIQGDALQVQGQYSNSPTVQLLLYGENTLLDSCTVTDSASQAFTLTTLPVHTGRVIYTLYTVAGKDTVSKDPIPFEVVAPGGISVLVLSNAPGFDNRFLLNWLSDHGYAAASRTAISKSKYQYTYANRQHLNLEQITGNTLSQFDILITDATTLQNSNNSELAAIREQVADKGMGIILTTDSTSLPALFTQAAYSLTMPSTAPLPVNITLPGNSHTVQLPAAPPLYIQPSNRLSPLIRDNQQHIRTAVALYGAGHLIANTLTHTFEWQLSGTDNYYNIFWSTLLHQAARKRSNEEFWQAFPFIPQVNATADIQLQTTGGEQPQGIINESSIAMARHPLLPFQWQGSYRPLNAGWQAGITTTGNTWWWYAYLPAEWQQVKAAEYRQATLQQALNINSQPATSTAQQQSDIPVSPLYAWCLLIICCTFLWWEGKHGIQAEKSGSQQ